MTIAIDADGRFGGYASVFDRLDESGDIVLPGAFRKSLRQRGRERVRMLFQHDPKEPVGTWETIAEDGFGLWVEGRLTAGVPRADESPGNEHRLVLHAWAADPSRRTVTELVERVVAVALTADLDGDLAVTHRHHERTDTSIEQKTGFARAAIALRFFTEMTM